MKLSFLKKYFILFFGLLFLQSCFDDDDSSSKTYLISNIKNIPVTEADFNFLNSQVAKIPFAHYSDGKKIDLVLSQAVVYYYNYYLYPKNFPISLDNIYTPEEFVSFLDQKDPFTYYYSPEINSYYSNVDTGDIGKIGFILEMVNSESPLNATNYLKINEISPFTRAWFDGFKVSDKIIAIDDQALLGMTYEEIKKIFPTKEGTRLTVTVERNEETIDIETACENNLAYLIEDRKIAYFSIRTFTDKTEERFKEDLESLFQNYYYETGKNIEKIILDLRDNTGGIIDGAFKLADFLIDQDSPSKTNLITTSEDNSGNKAPSYLGEYSEYNLVGFNEENFVVLTNSYSASSSEITVAALKYYGEATIIGTKTYGKGVGQYVMTLLDGSGIAITAIKNIAPDSTSYHLTGIEPDYFLNHEPASKEDDLVLQAAILFLNGDEIYSKNKPMKNNTIKKIKRRDFHFPPLNSF